MKLWHDDDWDFVLADNNPGDYVLAEDETGCDIFYALFQTQEEALTEIKRVTALNIDDVFSDHYSSDFGYFVVSIDWCGSGGLRHGFYE